MCYGRHFFRHNVFYTWSVEIISMDKTLEIIMVAMTLIVAAVVVTSMLQSESREFGDFSEDRRNDSSCGIAEVRYRNSLNCDASPPEESTASANIESAADSDGCDWPDTSTDNADDYC